MKAGLIALLCIFAVNIALLVALDIRAHQLSRAVDDLAEAHRRQWKHLEEVIDHASREADEARERIEAMQRPDAAMATAIPDAGPLCAFVHCLYIDGKEVRPR